MTGSSALANASPINVNTLISQITHHGNLTLVNAPQGVTLAWETPTDTNIIETAHYIGIKNIKHQINEDITTGKLSSFAYTQFTHEEYETYRSTPQGRALELPPQPAEKQGNTLGKITYVPPPAKVCAANANPPELLPEEIKGDKPNKYLQTLIDEVNDERSLWQRTTETLSSAWGSTKNVASASWENPVEFGKGALKGIGNIPSDMANLLIDSAKNGAGSPLNVNYYAKILDNQAIAAYRNDNITSANLFASQASSIREFGKVEDIFCIDNDAQLGGSIASIFIPLGTVIKASAEAAKISRAAKGTEIATDTTKVPIPSGPNGNGGKIEFLKKKPQPGTSEHKNDRWERYKNRGGEKSYNEWSKQYDVNMRNYQYGSAREIEYRKLMSASEGTLKTSLSNRQIDILKSDEMYAGQLKTGPVSLTKDNILAIQKDAELVKKNWQVEHILEKGASKPYLNALKEAGIDVHIGPKLP